MNTPFSSHAWNALRTRAAAQLRPSFADDVLRAARASGPQESQSWFASPFTISAVTAAVCLSTVCFLHALSTNAANLQNLEDWQEISVQTASLGLNP